MIDEMVMREFIAEIIRRCKKGDGKKNKPYCLYAKSSGRLLGRHSSRASARRQERAIKARGG